MVKKILFDLDNTLIDVPKQFAVECQKLLDKYNINIDPMDLYKTVGEYEFHHEYKYYKKEEIVKLVNSKPNLNISIELMEEFVKMYSTLITPVPDSIKDTLKYLSTKYELVILSNWFQDSQISRLKKAGIYKYFNKVYGTDKIPMKPRKESFNIAIGDLKPNECLIVGDSIEMDIKVPYEMGINVCFLNKKNIETIYPSIKKIEDLKEML